jgi:hypothetical protein
MAVETALGLRKHVTPRAMRRSFQDLARSAEVRDVVTRSISGHATEHMQRLYSTVTNQEQAASLTRILEMMPPGSRIARCAGGASAGSRANLRGLAVLSLVFPAFLCRRDRFRTYDPYRVKTRRGWEQAFRGVTE